MYVEEIQYSLLCATVYFDNLWKNKKENNSFFFLEFQFLDNILKTKKKSKLCATCLMHRNQYVFWRQIRQGLHHATENCPALDDEAVMSTIATDMVIK